MSEKQRILMVDDDIQAVDTVETLLQSVGYETNHAYMAAEGIQLARTWKPDLILLDVMFAGPPGPDGFEVSRDLHADPDLKDTPVIILSDEVVGHIREKVFIPDADQLEFVARKTPTVPREEFIPFKPDKDGVPFMPAFNTGYRIPVISQAKSLSGNRGNAKEADENIRYDINDYLAAEGL